MRAIVQHVLFPRPAASYTIDSFPGELIWIPRAPEEGNSDETVPCLLLPYESARYLVIYFHSNAEDLGRCRWFCNFIRDQFQVHVLAVEYPGYGVCPNTPTRSSVLAHARAALYFSTQVLRLPLEQIKIFGRSIGTGPALDLASQFEVAGLVLVTPFQSVRELFKYRIGPLSSLVEEWFDNERAMRLVKSPTMIVHGRLDTIIPCSQGEALYQICEAKRMFVNPPNMEHNTNLLADISFLVVPMFRFFSLPDYSFEDLKIPAWAFDKRRSQVYVRPELQAASRKGLADMIICQTGSAQPEDDDDVRANFVVPLESILESRTQASMSTNSESARGTSQLPQFGAPGQTGTSMHPVSQPVSMLKFEYEDDPTSQGALQGSGWCCTSIGRPGKDQSCCAPRSPSKMIATPAIGPFNTFSAPTPPITDKAADVAPPGSVYI